MKNLFSVFVYYFCDICLELGRLVFVALRREIYEKRRVESLPEFYTCKVKYNSFFKILSFFTLKDRPII